MKQTKGSERITVYVQRINVSVIVRPKVRLSGTSHNVLEGDNITLHCTVVDGFPKPQISWLKDELPLTEEKVTLVKTYITEEGEGTYTCVAKNEGGSAFDRIDIIVDAPPKRDASVNDDSMFVLFLSTLQLKCIERGDPKPNVTWTNNGTQVANNNTLVITNVTFKDAGQYGCVAKNRVGNVSGNIWIDVIEKPTVVISGESYRTRPEGDKLVLTCQTNDPTSEIRWTINTLSWGKMANITKNGDRSILIIERVKVSDTGKYICEANNTAGSASSSVDVEVRALQVNVRAGQAATEWYYIVGPVSAVAVTAFITCYLCRRRTRASSEQMNDMSTESVRSANKL
ncbi:neural cell adhesion molecule L1-like [Montipora foliosa]|uniref:neural cell adhesion molecule L1-like n=1 Tax=Montipora foliosa TaxID=591990 RepID=UPI0035F1B280